jgi:hypothetical protein
LSCEGTAVLLPQEAGLSTAKGRSASPVGPSLHQFKVLKHTMLALERSKIRKIEARVVGCLSPRSQGGPAPSHARVSREFPQSLVRRYMVTRCHGQRACRSNYDARAVDKEWETDGGRSANNLPAQSGSRSSLTVSWVRRISAPKKKRRAMRSH